MTAARHRKHGMHDSQAPTHGGERSIGLRHLHSQRCLLEDILPRQSMALTISPAWRTMSLTPAGVERVMAESAAEPHTKGAGHSSPCLRAGVCWPTRDER